MTLSTYAQVGAKTKTKKPKTMIIDTVLNQLSNEDEIDTVLNQLSNEDEIEIETKPDKNRRKKRKKKAATMKEKLEGACSSDDSRSDDSCLDVTIDVEEDNESSSPDKDLKLTSSASQASSSSSSTTNNNDDIINTDQQTVNRYKYQTRKWLETQMRLRMKSAKNIELTRGKKTVLFMGEGSTMNLPSKKTHAELVQILSDHDWYAQATNVLLPKHDRLPCIDDITEEEFVKNKQKKPVAKTIKEEADNITAVRWTKCMDARMLSIIFESDNILEGIVKSTGTRNRSELDVKEKSGVQHWVWRYKIYIYIYILYILNCV